MNNAFGLSNKSFTALIQALGKYPQVEEFIIFGDRVKRNYKKKADIDLAIKGKKCSDLMAMEIKGFLNENPAIPYFIGVFDYNSLKSQELKDHIDKKGKLLLQNEIATKQIR